MCSGTFERQPSRKEHRIGNIEGRLDDVLTTDEPTEEEIEKELKAARWWRPSSEKPLPAFSASDKGKGKRDGGFHRGQNQKERQ